MKKYFNIRRQLVSVLLFPLCLLAWSNGYAFSIRLAKNRKAEVCIVLQANPTVAQRFAGEELAGYLKKISGANFLTGTEEGIPSIRLLRKSGSNAEDYSIYPDKGNIVLSGNSDRAILYAVYDFLGRFGCLWFAPDFEIYSGNAEFVPKISDLIYDTKDAITKRPAFSFRTIDVDGGRTHNAENLKKLIEWMPRAGYNNLRFPVDLNGNGRVKWDRWREQLIPELKKRDLILEVGGHGYQNFINCGMEGEQLFKKHPEWFGKDSTCKYVSSDRLVFNTGNSEAVAYFIKNIVSYVKAHPEINIFGLWPPDVGRWQDCEDMKALGTPQDRQARLVNQVDSALKKLRPDLITEVIAYSYTLSVPLRTRLNKDILVDYCPINQSFEHQIYDGSSAANAQYAKELLLWRKEYKGNIGLYSYFRKYAWRSMPNVIPHYIQKEMQWYARLPLQGISTYAEPGDWFTYELNHYILGKLSWDPEMNVDKLIDKFLEVRYGENRHIAGSAYKLLEEVSPVYGSIPFSDLKPAAQIEKVQSRVEQQIQLLRSVKTSEYRSNNISGLLLMLEYLKQDLQIQHLRAVQAPRETILQQIKSLIAFLQANTGKGVILLNEGNVLPAFTKKYGLTNQSLLD